ncbi:MAG TPA: hybrid sensor histidine kinase/response regulator [Cyanobacteria bacterium UBA8803]|nr:hybrid sensor histidine kinase/response regulator [Cyanobacteria bacterium UBA9273]HBL62845.1 hybrid sensor histidine kinase/response regulator [Cyanobacteria bacterium UBA8803]
MAASFIEDAELREVYKITTRGRLQRLQESLQYLQKYPEDPATLEQLRREIHSLKGDSTSVEVETVANLAHCLEEIVLGIKNQQTVFSPELSDRFERGLDAISLLVEEAVTGQPSEVDVDDILHHLMTEVSDLHQPQPQPNPDNGHTHQVAASFIEDAELRDVYKISSQERLQKLEAGLLLLEKQPDDEATLEYLLREAHSLKGDSRSVGATNVETLIHQIEEVLLSIKHQETLLTSQLSDRLYYGLDAITLLVQEAVTGQPSGVDTAFALKHLMASIVAPTLRESQLVPPTEPSLPVKTSAKTVLQELPSIVVGEPYRIDTIRVETRELDALMSQAEELTVTRISIAHATAAIEEMAILWQDWKTFRTHGQRDLSSWGTNPYEERLEKVLDSLRLSAQENSTKLDLIAGELGEKIRTLRLLPLSTVFQVFPRMVRDLAKQQAKQVELVIEGGETTADKGILEEIKDSLMHMIRNAIDHGIETPEEREGLGKPSVATIWLRGYRDGNNIVIEVADDGRGLDVKKIKQTAIKRGLYRKEELATMTPSQIHALILAPGFSTRTFITEISGRGIGLDVVRTNVERFKGNIQIESTPGQGCTFRLQLGTTLATLNALFLEVQGIVHALPIEFVQTTLLVSPDEISTVEGRETIIFDGQEVVVVNLADLLELSNSPAYASTARVDNQLRSKGLIAGKGTREAGGVLPVTGMRYEQHKSDLRSLILLKVGEELAGFFVDRLWDTQEVVLKPQSPLLKRVRNVTGATILPTGEVCTILNPPDLIKSSQKQVTSTASITPKETVKRKPVILLVEDSLPVRTQERRLLEGAGYEVVIAVDGLDGYNKLKTREFDAVVSDVEMPNLDGFSLTGKIRQQEEYDELPIILVTTLDSDEDKRRGATAGANAYIIKGKFNQDFLLETLRKLV